MEMETYATIAQIAEAVRRYEIRSEAEYESLAPLLDRRLPPLEDLRNMPWYDEQEDGFEALIAYREPTDGTPAHPREQAAARPSAGQKESVCAIGQATEQAHALEEAKRFAEAEERAKARLAAQALKKRESEPCQSPEVREAKHRLAAIHQLHEDIRHPDVPEHRRQEYKRRLAALQMLDMCVDPGGTLLE